MIPSLIQTSGPADINCRIQLIDREKQSEWDCKDETKHFLTQEIAKDQESALLRDNTSTSIFVFPKEKQDENDTLEMYRRKAADVYETLKSLKEDKVEVRSANKENAVAFIEGLFLSAYRYDKYKTDDKAFSLNEISSKHVTNELNNLLQSVCWSRDLVNEVPINQSATDLAHSFEHMAAEIDGLEIEVLNKVQIESLRMGGLLGINKGSIEPPTFTILSWKPENAKNEKPIVVVGKGVTYDTGGINLKPTGFLETMKSDMGGSAIASGIIRAVASNKLPVYMIAIIPATDNRPGQQAIVPGDVLNMMNGKTVEIVNTDAEGRMILADGLSYATKFDPELLFSIATLTGSAARALGSKCIVSMGNAKNELADLHKAAFQTGERTWEMPFWEDYGKELQSNIADLKHLGSINAGMITAGKFLENFAEAPYVHLDIAGVSFNEKPENYNPIGGTGSGVRSLYQFIKQKYDLD